jgi:hypothetical protein
MVDVPADAPAAPNHLLVIGVARASVQFADLQAPRFARGASIASTTAPLNDNLAPRADCELDGTTAANCRPECPRGDRYHPGVASDRAWTPGDRRAARSPAPVPSISAQPINLGIRSLAADG